MMFAAFPYDSKCAFAAMRGKFYDLLKEILGWFEQDAIESFYYDFEVHILRIIFKDPKVEDEQWYICKVLDLDHIK